MYFCVGSSFAGFCVFAANPEEGERINGKITDQIIIVTLSSVVAFPAPLITGPDMDKFRWLSVILTATLVT